MQSVHLHRYKEQVYSVIASYLDESFDMRNAGFFVVGGLIARFEPLFDLGRKWEALLRRPDLDLEYYKASECERGTGQFRKFVKVDRHPTPEESVHLQAISNDFISLIIKEKVAAFGIGVIQDDFYEVIKDDYAHSVLGDDPFRLAYDLAMVQCAWMMKQKEKSEKKKALFGHRVGREHVSFVRDTHQKYAPLAATRYTNLKNSTPEAGQYMSAHTIADDKEACVLQAADATVYEVRRALHIANKKRLGPIRGQFQLFRQSSRMAIIQTVIKQNLLNTVKLHKSRRIFQSDRHYGD
jgi:hypothetical protein